MGNCNYNFLFLLFVTLSIMFNPHICRYMFGFCFIWNFQFFINIHIIIYKLLFQNNFIIYYIILVFVCYCFVCVALFRFAQIKYKSVYKHCCETCSQTEFLAFLQLLSCQTNSLLWFYFLYGYLPVFAGYGMCTYNNHHHWGQRLLVAARAILHIQPQAGSVTNHINGSFLWSERL